MKLRSILLIDDDEVTNFYNEHLLYKMEVAEHIHVEQNGKAGLDYLLRNAGQLGKQTPPELILLDINMPIMNGFEFLEAYESLDKEERGKQLIVMLTSSMLDVDKERAAQFSCLTDYISKPLTEAQINSVVEMYFPDDADELT